MNISAGKFQFETSRVFQPLPPARTWKDFEMDSTKCFHQNFKPTKQRPMNFDSPINFSLLITGLSLYTLYTATNELLKKKTLRGLLTWPLPWKSTTLADRNLTIEVVWTAETPNKPIKFQARVWKSKMFNLSGRLHEKFIPADQRASKCKVEEKCNTNFLVCESPFF